MCMWILLFAIAKKTVLITLDIAGIGGNNLLDDLTATRSPAKVDETTHKVSLALPANAEAAVKHAQTTSITNALDDFDEYPVPTEEEKATLRKIPARVSFVSFALCIVEFAERASYYGAKTVFNNFIQFPLPKG